MDKTALLVLDIQNGIVELLQSALDESYLDRLCGAIAAARAAQIPVIQVTTGFRASYADVSPRNRTMAAARSGRAFAEPDPSTELHPRVLAAHAGDDGAMVHVRKRRVSALHGTDLGVVLRSLGVGTLAVAGVATGGAVLSTVRQAADEDYGLVVLADLCADADREVHDVLVGKVFPKQAVVMSAGEWAEGLRK